MAGVSRHSDDCSPPIAHELYRAGLRTTASSGTSRNQILCYWRQEKTPKLTFPGCPANIHPATRSVPVFPQHHTALGKQVMNLACEAERLWATRCSYNIRRIREIYCPCIRCCTADPLTWRTGAPTSQNMAMSKILLNTGFLEPV